MPIKASHWFESLSNAVTDGKVADILRAKIDLIETQRDDALLRAGKAEARILVLEDENKQLQRELADFRKADRQKDDSHGLPELAVKLLQLIASHKDSGSYSIRDHMGLQDAKFDHLIDKLKVAEFVRFVGSHPDVGSHYIATAEGRDFLARHDLL